MILSFWVPVAFPAVPVVCLDQSALHTASGLHLSGLWSASVLVTRHPMISLANMLLTPRWIRFQKCIGLNATGGSVRKASTMYQTPCILQSIT